MLRFQLFRIPIRVHAFFFVTCLFLWMMSGRQSGETLAILVPTVFLGILLHEFGHALVGRAFGLSPNIELHGFGGVTWWSGASRELTPGRGMMVSAAGPLVGVVIGLAVMFAFLDQLPRNDLSGYAVQTIVWVNLGWGIFNLAPMLPLDGGNIMADFFRLFSPENGRTWARYVSFVTVAGLAVVFFALGAAVMAAFMLYFGYQNYRGLALEREQKKDGPLIPHLVQAQHALSERDPIRARQLAGSVVEQAQTSRVKSQALNLVAASHFAERDLDRAQAVLDQIPRGQPRDPFLQGVIHYERGQVAEALPYLEAVFREEPSAEVFEFLALALLRSGRGAEVRALLESGGLRELDESARRRIRTVALAESVDDVATLLQE